MFVCVYVCVCVCDCVHIICVCDWVHVCVHAIMDQNNVQLPVRDIYYMLACVFVCMNACVLHWHVSDVNVA